MAVWLRFQVVLIRQPEPLMSSIMDGHVFWGQECCPSNHQPDAELVYRKESYSFLAISWLASIGSVLHIIYGTLILSGTFFISVGDALIVTARFLASRSHGIL